MCTYMYTARIHVYIYIYITLQHMREYTCIPSGKLI